MCFRAIAVANTILDMAAKKNIFDVTPMKLQKLVFLAHALYYKQHDKKLVIDDIEKWDYGPVIPEVYREFRGFKGSPITRYADNADGKVDIVPPYRKDIHDHIEKVLEVFGNTGALRLSQLTHMEGTAWSLADSYKITDDNIKNGVIYRDR